MAGDFEVWIAGQLLDIVTPKSGSTGDFEVWVAGNLLDIYVSAGGTDVLTASEMTLGAWTLDSPTILEATFLRPASDVNAGLWTPSTGTTLYETIDEITPSDVDYMRSDNSPSASAATVGLQSGADPSQSSFHIVRYRYRKEGTGTINLTFALYEGATQRANWFHNNITDTFVTGEYTLSSAEADSITDYTALRLRVQASEV